MKKLNQSVEKQRVKAETFVGNLFDKCFDNNNKKKNKKKNYDFYYDLIRRLKNVSIVLNWVFGEN